MQRAKHQCTKQRRKSRTWEDANANCPLRFCECDVSKFQAPDCVHYAYSPKTPFQAKNSFLSGEGLAPSTDPYPSGRPYSLPIPHPSLRTKPCRSAPASLRIPARLTLWYQEYQIILTDLHGKPVCAADLLKTSSSNTR